MMFQNKTYLATILIPALLAGGCASVQTRESLLQRSQEIKARVAASRNNTGLPDTTRENPDSAAFPGSAISTTAQRKPGLPNPNPAATDDTTPQRFLRKLPDEETLVYKARYLGMTIGTMTARIVGKTTFNGRPAYKFEATAKTDGFFEKIFKINDRFVSYMDAEHFYTLRHEVYREEGNYKKTAIVDFDQVNHKAYYRHLVDGSNKVIDIPPGVQDPLTANYYFRMLPLALGDMVEFPVYVDEKVYDFFALMEKTTTIHNAKLGRQEVFILQPYALLEGEMVKKGRATGYFLPPAHRFLPVRGIVKTPIFGSAAVELYDSPVVNDKVISGKVVSGKS